MLFWFVCLLVVAQTHVGPLWRDEINTKWMSLRSGPAELWRYACFDSFPVVWYLILRGWIAAGLAHTDQGFRWLGGWVGLGQLAAALWIARLQSKRWPLVFLAIFILSPTLLRFGTSLRAYGMGILTMLLMIGWVWAYVDRPSGRRFAAAAAASLLAVHTIYYNSTVLCVLCVAGAGSLLLARSYRAILALGLLGFVSGLSVLPYILGPLHRAGTWGDFIRGKVDLGILLQRCGWAIDAPLRGLSWAWFALALVVFLGCGVGCLRWHSSRRRRRALFVLLALPLIFAAHFSFLLTLGIMAQPWYYLTFLAFTAVLVDRGADLLIRRNVYARAVRLAAVAAIVLLSARGTFNLVHTRITNMDVIARVIANEASPNDCVIIHPWYLGIAFDYYYRGSAPWSTLPTIDDLRVHRIDLLRDSLMHPEGAQPLLERVRQALDSGHRVWYIGDPELPPAGREIRPIPKPTEVGGGISPSDTFWAYHVGYEIVKRKARVGQVNLPISQPVSDYEGPPLLRIEVVK
ncbi:MAG: hypothetical protein NTW19_12665 [Planctomycetota bacterium]|nr:hypothetical protein [Planctomycetota bacterium]